MNTKITDMIGSHLVTFGMISIYHMTNGNYWMTDNTTGEGTEVNVNTMHHAQWDLFSKMM